LWKSSIPQARRRLRGVPALPAEQKSRYQLVVSDRANADGRMHPQLHADDARARSRRLSLRLRERLCSPARTPRCRSSSIPQAKRRLHRVLALLAEQKNRY